jgi:hypothetical protein
MSDLLATIVLCYILGSVFVAGHSYWIASPRCGLAPQIWWQPTLMWPVVVLMKIFHKYLMLIPWYRGRLAKAADDIRRWQDER